jgi:hypothetical protein
MHDEKTLEEALDEFDGWGDQVADATQGLSDEELIEYFRQSQSRLEQATGRRLNLPSRPAPRPTHT